ncbi:GIMAP4 [Symbiodinium sp. CCMP2456]|nr:GIMAP4 [Symbiodinium sp. CCMP2456]
MLYCPSLVYYAGKNLAQQCKGLYTGSQVCDQMDFKPLFGKNSRTSDRFREMLLEVLNGEDLSAKLVAERALREQDKKEMEDARALAERRRHELDKARADAEDLRQQQQQVTNVKFLCGIMFLLGVSAGLSPYVFGNIGFYIRARGCARIRAAALMKRVRAVEADLASERQYATFLREQQASLQSDMANQAETVKKLEVGLSTKRGQLVASEAVVAQQREALKKLEGAVKTGVHQLAASEGVVAQQREALITFQASLQSKQYELEQLRAAMARQQEGCQAKQDESQVSHAAELPEPEAGLHRTVAQHSNLHVTEPEHETPETGLEHEPGKPMEQESHAKDINMTQASPGFGAVRWLCGSGLAGGLALMYAAGVPMPTMANVWRVHGWDGRDGIVFHIRRADSIQLLRELGGGSVLNAKGKCIVEEFAGGSNRCKVLIEHLWQTDESTFAADLVVLQQL